MGSPSCGLSLRTDFVRAARDPSRQCGRDRLSRQESLYRCPEPKRQGSVFNRKSGPDRIRVAGGAVASNRISSRSSVGSRDNGSGSLAAGALGCESWIARCFLSLDTSKNRGAGISRRKKNKDMTNLFFRNGKLTSEEMDDSAECKRLLNLDPDIYEFRLVFGASAESKQEIAVQTRSLSQIMLP